MKIYVLSILFTLWGMAAAFGQKTFSDWLKPGENFEIKPFVMAQFWSSYSTGQERYVDSLGRYEPIGDRFNVMIRRARLGFRVKAYENFKFVLVGAYDQLGRDVNTSLVGGPNNGSLPEFGIWDAFAQWRVLPGREALHLTVGYFRPQLSRESITSGWSVNSMEKSMSQNYIRRHLVGFGPGRAVGINLGGLLPTGREGLSFNYNVGIFTPQYLNNFSFVLGQQFSPLYVGRVVVNLGEAEQEKYKIAYDINYYNRRKGLSVGMGCSWQGGTNLFESSYATGVDFLFNWGPLNLDGDWNFMWRQNQRDMGNEAVRDFTYFSNTGHLRAGYNIVLGKFFLEPSFMLMQFNGATDRLGQEDAAAVLASSGRERTYDVGLNWYLNKKRLKLMLHYTWRSGDAGAAGEGAVVNQYFLQSGLGAIRRGNWIGLGLHMIL
jgi:hypothetical protein